MMPKWMALRSAGTLNQILSAFHADLLYAKGDSGCRRTAQAATNTTKPVDHGHWSQGLNRCRGSRSRTTVLEQPSLKFNLRLQQRFTSILAEMPELPVILGHICSCAYVGGDFYDVIPLLMAVYWPMWLMFPIRCPGCLDRSVVNQNPQRRLL
jgi:hypothetical protein